jgi:hypothetical protein
VAAGRITQLGGPQFEHPTLFKLPLHAVSNTSFLPVRESVKCSRTRLQYYEIFFCYELDYACFVHLGTVITTKLVKYHAGLPTVATGTVPCVHYTQRVSDFPASSSGAHS